MRNLHGVADVLYVAGGTDLSDKDKDTDDKDKGLYLAVSRCMSGGVMFSHFLGGYRRLLATEGGEGG